MRDIPTEAGLHHSRVAEILPRQIDQCRGTPTASPYGLRRWNSDLHVGQDAAVTATPGELDADLQGAGEIRLDASGMVDLYLSLR